MFSDFQICVEPDYQTRGLDGCLELESNNPGAEVQTENGSKTFPHYVGKM